MKATNQVVKVQVQNPVAQDQAMGGHSVARIYEVVKTGESLSAEELRLRSPELKMLYARREALRIRTNNVPEIHLIVNQVLVLVCGLPTSQPQDGGLGDARASSRWHEQDGG